jgi:hypothetical protein
MTAIPDETQHLTGGIALRNAHPPSEIDEALRVGMTESQFRFKSEVRFGSPC